MAGDQSAYTRAFDEWKEARSVISRFDGYLDGLRRYGFVFIATLLAANSIQIYFNFNNFTKLFLSLITIVFIVSLYLLDTYYRRIIEAASIRARILETVVLLDIELNDIISDKFEEGKLQGYIKKIYNGFIVIAMIIGAVVIIADHGTPSSTLVNSSTQSTTQVNSSALSTTFGSSSTLTTTSVIQDASSISLVTYILLLLLAGASGVYIINYLSDKLALKYPRGRKEDWIIDNFSCKQGDKVRITVTNLDKTEIKFNVNEVVCEIMDKKRSFSSDESRS
ncbi:cupredoxin domain-containing protein [Methanosarcina horonobensis]|uniref:hypothetical protein n=1 Tax=Methanosarcina horonobensis TaxID=418008 RepID=UPI000B0D03E2|nr:hypothetical protein [Methanosarcina horonobensis]